MYNGYKVLDVHQHVSAPAAARSWITGQLSSNSPSKSPLSGGGNPGPGMSDEDFYKANQTGTEYMTDRSIDVGILGPRPFTMMGWMEPHLLPGWCTFTNDTIFKQVQNFPNNYVGAAMLPQISEAPDLSNCIPELERCVNDLNFKAVYLSPDPAGKRTTPGMDQPYWYPVYEKCQQLGLPIIVHGTNCLDPRLRSGVIPANYQVGFVWEQYLAWQLLAFSDVFDRYPELKIVVCHGGGALSRFIPTDNHRPQKDLSNNLFYDTCVYEKDLLATTIKQRGVPSILFGTEAPGSGRSVRPETGKTSDDLVPVIDEFDFLSDDDKKKIFNENPARFCPAMAKI